MCGMPRIERIEVAGFRAFGAQPQVMELRGPMALIFASNSQGKTSLAEAIEFLLTGRTVRREFVASADREFAEALRNVHLQPGDQVWVKAQVKDQRGSVRTIQRRLVRDYTGRDACTSELFVDGSPASDLDDVGIKLSQPPLEAPVLMQHTLRYVVSAGPKERADYFKALLEVSDLEEVRSVIAGSRRVLEVPTHPVGHAFETCVAHEALGGVLRPLESGECSHERITDALSQALGTLLSSLGPVPDAVEDRVALAKSLLQSKREASFPIHGFACGASPSWALPDDSLWTSLHGFISQRRFIEREGRWLARLFEALLELPGFSQTTKALDCPVCGTPEALTPQRISAIKSHLVATEAYRTAEEAARDALSQLRIVADHIERGVMDSLPEFFRWDPRERVRRGFTEDAIRSLVGQNAENLLGPWRETISSVEKAVGEIKDRAEPLRKAIDGVDLNELTDDAVESLKALFSGLDNAARALREKRDAYVQHTEPLLQALQSELDKRINTVGWQQLIDLVGQQDALLDWLIGRRVRLALAEKFDRALEEVDQAKARVLDDKFAEISSEIERWWRLLRPDELDTFGGVQRGGSGRRFVDLKARMAKCPGDVESSVLRDAVAVFSDSQLNALGLSAFLARSVREGAGFVVLDDPVPATDDEHRAMFVHRVLNELIRSGIQVIILTHHQRMWTDIQEAYAHLDLDTFVVTLEDRSRGSVIESNSGTMDALLAAAEPYVANSNSEIRKVGASRLRDAAERFCKLMLVMKDHQNGRATASVSDYDGQNLGQLVPRVLPLLVKDPSHAGKLRVMGRALNPGAHDDVPPPPSDLRVCLGDLKTLRNEYLGRNN